MSELSVFAFDSSAVRVIMIDGEPWFVAADVCDALGLDDTSKAVSRLDDDEKGTNTVRTPSGDQQMLIINESGMYSLIMTSRKPEAKRFKKWVTAEVLPTIRKTGRYENPDQLERAARAPRIPAHEADRIVAASRTFNAMLRSSQAARIPLPTALRRAAEVALRETGIDMLAELKAESHMADLDAKAAARAKASTVPDWADDAPQSPAHFWQMWSEGQLEVPFQSCTSAQAYQAYVKWCQLTGQAFTARHTQFTPLLQRAAAEAGAPVHVKPMNLGEAGNYRTERMLLISRPPDESQGAWATALARQFEAPLRAFLAQKRASFAH